MKYVNYKDIECEACTAPKPYYPPILPRVRLSKSGYDRQIMGHWFKLYKIEIYWGVPKRARYVEKYHLEFLSTFKGHAKVRTLHTLDIHPFSPVRATFRHQKQDKIKPIEGIWKDKRYG